MVRMYSSILSVPPCSGVTSYWKLFMFQLCASLLTNNQYPYDKPHKRTHACGGGVFQWWWLWTAKYVLIAHRSPALWKLLVVKLTATRYMEVLSHCKCMQSMVDSWWRDSPRWGVQQGNGHLNTTWRTARKRGRERGEQQRSKDGGFEKHTYLSTDKRIFTESILGLIHTPFHWTLINMRKSKKYECRGFEMS